MGLIIIIKYIWREKNIVYNPHNFNQSNKCTLISSPFLPYRANVTFYRTQYLAKKLFIKPEIFIKRS